VKYFNILFYFSSICLFGCSSRPNLEIHQLSQQVPEKGVATSIGGYNSGCLIGAVSLPISQVGLETMRVSRGRFWGHPNLINFITSSAKQVQKKYGVKLSVSDLGHAKGGPSLTGHASHQIGLDVDIWMQTFPSGKALDLAQRETISASSVLTESHEKLNPKKWTPRERGILKILSGNNTVQRIFVTPLIKKQLCDHPTHHGFNNDQLKKIRPWWGHNDHFHVRLKCPGNGPLCKGQADPKDIACDKTLAWWFTEEALEKKEEEVDFIARFLERRKNLPNRCHEIL
jgi:penicillin-insensitive murein DD-endopeptidase